MICYAKTSDAPLEERKDSWLNGSNHMDLLIMQVFAEDMGTFLTSIFIAKEEETRVATFRALEVCLGLLG